MDRGQSARGPSKVPGKAVKRHHTSEDLPQLTSTPRESVRKKPKFKATDSGMGSKAAASLSPIEPTPMAVEHDAFPSHEDYADAMSIDANTKVVLSTPIIPAPVEHLPSTPISHACHSTTVVSPGQDLVRIGVSQVSSKPHPASRDTTPTSPVAGPSKLPMTPVSQSMPRRRTLADSQQPRLEASQSRPRALGMRPKLVGSPTFKVPKGPVKSQKPFRPPSRVASRPPDATMLPPAVPKSVGSRGRDTARRDDAPVPGDSHGQVRSPSPALKMTARGADKSPTPANGADSSFGDVELDWDLEAIDEAMADVDS